MFLTNLYKNSQPTFWLASERVAAALMGLITTYLIARFMGPVNFGIFSFSFAAIGLGLAASQLGMDSLLIRYFVRSDQSDAKILGTAVILKATASLISFVAILFVFILFTDASQTEFAIFSLSISIFILSSVTSVLGPWFKAREDFKPLFLIRILATAVSISFKILVIILDLSIVAMAAAHILYYFAETMAFLLFFYRRKGLFISSWSFDKATAKDMLLHGAPLFLGTMIAVTYMSIDVIMLNYILGPRTVGEYAMIPQVMGALQIVPYALTSAAFPSILNLVKKNELEKVARRCLSLYSKLLLLAVLASISVIFLVSPLIPIIFGAEYQSTIPPMLISAAAIPLIFIRHLNTKLFVAYGVRYEFVKMELAGLVINVTLNFALIPIYGSSGAAIATVFAYVVSTCVMPLAFKKSRAIFLPIFGFSQRTYTD